MMDWGKKVKELREKALITQNELAKMVGVSFATINRYENGHHEPTMKVKRQLMALFKKYRVLEAE